MVAPHDDAPAQALSPASIVQRRRLGMGVIALSVLTVLLVAAAAPLPLRVPLVVLSATLLPGYPVVNRLPVDLPTLLALQVCASLAIEAAVTFVLVEARFWHPLGAGVVLAGLAVGATLVSVGALRDSGVSAPPVARTPDRAGPLLAWLVAAVAAALWGVALTQTDVTALPSLGLLPVLPRLFWVGLVIAVAGAVVLTHTRRLRHGPLLAYLGLLLAMLYATAPALEDTPRYTYTYKHIAITQYIERYGSVDKTIDIYHRWPGFFSLSAWFSEVSGLFDPTSYAAWAEVYFTAIDALLVWACVHAVARSQRTAWQATVLFTITNWVGQDYYSPQAFGYVLMLGVLLVCVVALRARPGPFGRLVERIVAFVFRTRGEPRSWATTGFTRGPTGRAIGLAVLLDAVLAASHQLTPYVLLMQLGALVVGGYLRPWWVLVAAGLTTVGYLVPNYDFIVNKYGLFASSDPLANARGQTVDGIPAPDQLLIQHLALGSAGVCFLLAFIGLVRRARRGHLSDGVLVGALAFTPVLTLVAQDYGGEAKLRVYLYALPWLCIGLAWVFSPEGEPRSWLPTLVPVGLSLGLTAAFVAQFLGREDINILTRDEVGAAAYLFNSTNVQPGSVLMLTSPSFPARYGPLYFRLSRADLPALTYHNFGERPLLFPREGDVDAAAALIEAEQGSDGYLVFSQGQAAYARDYQLYPPYALRAFEGAVAQSARFRIVYDRPTARVYRLVPQPSSGP